MAEATQKDAEKRPLPGSPEARESGRRNLNSQIAQRQKMLLAGIGAIALIGGGMFIFGGDGDEGGSDANGAATIDTGGLVNRNLSQREFVASYGNRLDAQGRAIKDLQQSQLPRPEIEQELEALRSENAQMRSDGQAAIDAISTENANLRSQLSEAAKAPATAPPLPPPPAYGPGVGTGGAVQPPQRAPEAQGGQLSLMSFIAETGKDGKPRAAETAPALLLEASRDYLPPNSYAPATVIVGVDASTGVASQSDPLPVVLRITGPARSVMRGNKLLTTDITGCLVNGAARGDLSAEKVYVKLVRMTCAQPGGRFAVSEVKGFISFAGKSGVRGRVVSREGSLVSQALLAGIVGGFGRGFSANANGIFTGQVGANGQREALSPTDILAGGFGQGAGEAADTVIRRDIKLEVQDDRLILRTERFRETGRDEEGNPEVGECYPDHFDVRHYAVRSTPERWAPWECARLIGDSHRPRYVTGFFYLAAWGPLFVILHMILMFKGAGDVAAAGGSTGLSLATFAGMSDVNSDIGILAGYLVASIPFLAGGVARGALAISGQATSYLNPSQNAAEEASREASTGNVSLGNSNIDNSTVFSRQFAQGNLAPNITYGATQTRGFSDSGTQTTSFPDGEFAAVPNSSYPFTPTLGQDFTGRLGTLASQSRTQSEAYANLAQQSTSSALTRFSEIRNAYSQGQSSDTVSGVGTNDSIGTAFSEVDNASAGGPSMPDGPDRSAISDEVERVRQQGRGRIGTVRGYLDRQTQGATGASEEAADDIKEWGNR